MTSDAVYRRFVYIPPKALIASFVLHISFVIGLFLLGALSSSNWVRKQVPEAYQTFIQVDVVDMPDFLPNPAVDMTLPASEEPKKPDSPPVPIKDEMALPNLVQNSEAEKKKEEKAKSRKEKEKALEKIREAAKREKIMESLKKAEADKATRPKLKGNIVSAGNASAGKLGTPQDRYKALLSQAIKDHVNYYAWQKKKGLLAVVTIEIYPTGMVRQKRLDKPSTDPLFNTAVLQAIDQSQPLPLPEDLSILRGGITIAFSPDED